MYSLCLHVLVLCWVFFGVCYVILCLLSDLRYVPILSFLLSCSLCLFLLNPPLSLVTTHTSVTSVYRTSRKQFRAVFFVRRDERRSEGGKEAGGCTGRRKGGLEERQFWDQVSRLSFP